MKEFPVILILQPLNFSTLAALVDGYATKKLLKDDSLKCLTIVTV